MNRWNHLAAVVLVFSSVPFATAMGAQHPCANLAPVPKPALCTAARAAACQEELLSERAAFALSANVVGGKGGIVYEVTSLEDDPHNPLPGTLRYGARLPQPAWIIFRVSGVIQLKGKIKILRDKTIDGRGANVTIRGGTLSITDAPNVIINDVTVRETPDGDNITVTGQASRGAWIHHVEFGQAGDENFSATHGASDITLSWSRLADQREKTMLLAAGKDDERGRIAIHHNHWQGGGSRLPKIGGYQVHLFNNFYDRPDGHHDVTCYSGCELLAEGNVYDPGKRGQVVILDDGAEGHTPGFVKARGNLLLRGCRIQESSPDKVLDFGSIYGNAAEGASADLQCRVQRQAGPR